MLQAIANLVVYFLGIPIIFSDIFLFLFAELSNPLASS